MKKNFLISTGGSGGHVILGMILYDHLSKKSDVIISIDKRGIRFFDESVYKFEVINTPKLNNIILLPLNLIKILFLTFKSFFLLKKRNIEKIFSTGGYMSLPLILAGKLLNLEIYLLEPNLVLGRANRYFLKYCEKIFCYTKKIKNFPDSFKKKMVITNPLVKESFYNLKSLKKNDDKFTIMIVGGSQGAQIFDNDLKKSIVNISQKKTIRVIQQTNEKNIFSLSAFYSKNGIENKIFNFDKNFQNIVSQADLCITRAGATTLAELSILNIPFIAVPLPTSKDNHQVENANFYKNNDCCWIIDQNHFEEKIEEILSNILNNESDYLKKRENLKKLNYQNTWINVNQKILNNINEN